MLDAGKVDFMSYSNQTTHYGLPLPTSSDRSVWTDNNTAFEAIDGAIYTASQNASGASEAVSAMSTTVTGHTASISTLNANVATLSTSVSGLESDLDTAESDIATAKTDITAIRTSIDNLELALNGKQTTISKGIFNGNIDEIDTVSVMWVNGTIASGTQPTQGYYVLITLPTGSGNSPRAQIALSQGNVFHTRVFVNSAWTAWS